MNGLETLSILLSTTLILLTYTILYRENPAFRLAEHIMVGATVGHAVVLAVFQVRDLAWIKFYSGITKGVTGSLIYIIPMILGVLLYFQFSSRYRYMSRVSIALMLAVGLALSIRGLIPVNVIGQIKGALSPLRSIEAVAYLVGVVCVLLYFVYEERTSRFVGPLPKIGRYVLMLTMGAYFANAIMGRVSIVIGTLNTVLVAPAWYLIPVAFLAILADAIARRKTSR
ncbi:MAG: hypothetical protein QW638_01435 [Candidatus Bathyarchaeia archaeon]|nr:hypothetical protein [Candidatus Bathyarchaeota archaeon]